MPTRLCLSCGQPVRNASRHRDCEATARGLPADWPQRVARIRARDGGRCVVCGSTVDLRCDHIVPRRAGGSDDDSNLRMICAKCDPDTGSRKKLR